MAIQHTQTDVAFVMLLANRCGIQDETDPELIWAVKRDLQFGKRDCGDLVMLVQGWKSAGADA